MFFFKPIDPDCMKVLPLKRFGSAWSNPLFSVPAIGWPPTKAVSFPKIDFASDKIFSFVLATSVIINFF